MMTSLKKVQLDGRRQWQGIPEHFHQAFLDCIHLSSMEDVSIAPLGFPLSALHNVKKLALFHWRQGDYTPDTIELDDGVAHKFNQLESLSLTDFERDPLQKVVALIPPCTLRSLSISVGRYYFRDIFPYEELASLFANCSNSLTNLELNPRWQCSSCLSLSSTLYLNLSLDNSHSFFMGNERSSESRGQNFQFTLSTLIYLERITFLTKVSISVTHTRGGRASWRFSSPIPIIEHVMKTISSQRLKLLKLDFYFNINSLDPPPNVIWSSLVHLVAESPFPCTKLHVRVGFQELVGYQDIAPDIILNSLAESAELMSYVNRGVLVITSNPVTNKQGAPTVGPLL